MTVCGITPAYQEVQGLDIASGRNIRELDQEEGLQVCIVGAGTAKELYGTTEVLGSSIRIDGYDYRIVGVLEEEDSSVMGSTNNSVYIPLVNAQRMLKQTAITNFYVTAEDETSLTQAQDTIDAYLLKNLARRTAILSRTCQM